MASQPPSPAKPGAKEDKKSCNDESRRLKAEAMLRDHKFVTTELSKLYRFRLQKIEEQCLFNQFHHDPMTEAEIVSRPAVLLLGQYSTGKTSFIRRIIAKDYPNMHVGPEPSTDRFIAVVPGRESRTVKGNSLTVVPDLPYQGLTKFGTTFLHKFEAAVVTDAPLLEAINFVDTPGVLAGEKQKREYDFLEVAKWFAERSDLVLLMFDGLKLDISDEFKAVINMLKPYPEKVRVVLNKADQIPTDELVRVFGALMWSLGKIFNTPEVLRVYIGSFWDEPLKEVSHRSLMERDMKALLADLEELPSQSSVRRIQEMVIRVRLLRVHMCVLGRLRSEMPWAWQPGHAKRKQYLLDNLEQIIAKVCEEQGFSNGDMGSVGVLREKLRGFDFKRLPALSHSALRALNKVLTVDIPPIIDKVHGVDTSEAARLGRELSVEIAGGRDSRTVVDPSPPNRWLFMARLVGLFILIQLVIFACWVIYITPAGGSYLEVARTIYEEELMGKVRPWLMSVSGLGSPKSGGVAVGQGIQGDSNVSEGRWQNTGSQGSIPVASAPPPISVDMADL